ncbi:MAG TPA: OpgC domain-containing protein, partial [Rudaea sp.]|nr:OpgC domain-containing protein [Rudaea sp.]
LVYTHYTLANISLSDAADLFVFLAGWSLRLMAEGRGERPMPTRAVMLRLGGRALELYAAQVLITMIAIAILAITAIEASNPLLLEWNNAAAVFNDPVPTHIGLAVLTHQLGYFDILPLYVVLMLLGPLFALIDRYAPNVLLPLSFALYLIVLAFRITLPTWPESGTWFFNPLAWQFVFVLGFVMAKDAGIGAWVRRNIVALRIVGVPILIAGAVIVLFDLYPDPTKVPDPKLFFIADKTYVTPMRVIQFLAQVAVFSFAFRYIVRLGGWIYTQWFVAPLIGLLAMLGRNSLYVFCIGSLLSLSAQVLRYFYRGSPGIDTAVVITGVVIMAFTAWLAEARQRIPR